MKKKVLLLIGTVIIFCSISLTYAYLDFPNKLSGHFKLSGENFTDPPLNHPTDTHFYISLEGKPAEVLWNAMKVAPFYDECLADGSTSKKIKNMQCTQSKDVKQTTCYFGIDIAKQKIVSGTSC